MKTYFGAAHALVGGAMSGHPDGPVSEFIFSDGQTPPSESAIQSKLAELQAAEPIRLLRIDRDRLLVESDWTGLADVDMTNEKLAEWKLYRQKLRDLPKGLTTEFKVKNAVWPDSP